jgi:hypothetical protein
MKRALQKPALLAITVLFLVTGGRWLLRGTAGTDPAPQASKMDEPAPKPADLPAPSKGAETLGAVAPVGTTSRAAHFLHPAGHPYARSAVLPSDGVLAHRE